MTECAAVRCELAFPDSVARHHHRFLILTQTLEISHVEIFDDFLCRQAREQIQQLQDLNQLANFARHTETYQNTLASTMARSQM